MLCGQIGLCVYISSILMHSARNSCSFSCVSPGNPQPPHPPAVSGLKQLFSVAHQGLEDKDREKIALVL